MGGYRAELKVVNPATKKKESVKLIQDPNNDDKLNTFLTRLEASCQPFVGGEEAMNKLIKYIPIWNNVSGRRRLTDLNQRRRLAETKPLGWKPSQDMDWSPDYRQRRR